MPSGDESRFFQNIAHKMDWICQTTNMLVNITTTVKSVHVDSESLVSVNELLSQFQL